MTSRARAAVVGAVSTFRASSANRIDASGFRSSCASVARNLSLRSIRGGQLGGTIANPELQIAIQCVSVAFGRLQAVNQILVVESQHERGFDGPVESPRRDRGRDREYCAEESHDQMIAVAFRGHAQGGEETGREQEHEERLGPGRQQGSTTEHHAADCEDNQDFTHRSARRVKDDSAHAPACGRQGDADNKRRVPSAVLGIVWVGLLIAVCEHESRRRDQHHPQQPRRNDGARDQIPQGVGQERRDNDGDRTTGVGVLVEQAGFGGAYLPLPLISFAEWA